MSATASEFEPDQQRERRLRRLADQQGYRLKRLRGQDGYWLIDIDTGGLVIGDQVAKGCLDRLPPRRD
jgi:hypothetical protein